MGLLRTLLALSVVLDHAWPSGTVFVGGPNAVQCFYIISGFLISYILIERRSYSSAGSFYLNRYLRLYPTYIFVAVLTLVAVLLTHRSNLPAVYERSPASAVCVLALTNLLLIGQDWILFLGVRDQALVFTANFRDSDVYLFEGQLIHPSWTLGVELTFYLIAPFVLARRSWIYGLLAGSLALRLVFIAHGFGARDPWSYRFFPTELALFLVGALAHQILLPMYRRLPNPAQTRLVSVCTPAPLALVMLYFLLPVAEPYKKVFLLASVAACLPLAFMFQQRHAFDSWIGNLSYPIYICHMLVLELMHFALRRAGVLNPYLDAMLAVMVTIGVATLLNRYIAEPIEKLRDVLRKGAAGAQSDERWQALPAPQLVRLDISLPPADVRAVEQRVTKGIAELHPGPPSKPGAWKRH